MKKFLNITSPLTAFVILLLSASIIFFTTFSVEKLIELKSAISVVFFVLMLFSVVIVVFVIINQLKSGVQFYDEKFIFNSLDSDNEFKYSELKEVRVKKDDKISFSKNFTDRHAYISLTMINGRIHTIPLGLVSTGKLKKIKAQIEMRMK